jgi:DNA-binding ferritin-like protein
MAEEQKMTVYTTFKSIEDLVDDINYETVNRKLSEGIELAEENEDNTILELERKVVAVHKNGAWTREVVK